MTPFPRIAPLLLVATLAGGPLVALAETSTPAPAAPAKSTPAKKAAKPKAAAKTKAKSTKSAAPANAAKQDAPVPAPGGGQPTLLGQYGDWGAYAATPSGKKVCFVLARPKTSQTDPANRKRDPIYLFISTRPAENVPAEISYIAGYTYKANAEATAAIGSNTFAMYTQRDGAWIKNVADEPKMVEAMRKGDSLVMKGESSFGTKTTDTFSLSGVTQAIDRSQQECKK